MSFNAQPSNASSFPADLRAASGFVNSSSRMTRRRSSAGPVPPNRPLRREAYPGRSNVRPTFLTLRDHGKVFVADLPRLSDGQLAHVGKEAREVLDSLSRRLEELDQQLNLNPQEQETRIRAATKRDVTERFIRAVDEEQEQRRSNPALKAAAGESLARAFLEIARHRLPGATFDSLLQEALTACDEGPGEAEADEDGEEASREAQAPLAPEPPRARVIPLVKRPEAATLPERERMTVVLTPDPSPQMSAD